LPDIVVFDSSAILALLFGEPGGHKIVSLLYDALLSTVNLAEIHTRLLQEGQRPAEAWGRILDLKCTVIPFAQDQARIAAELIPITRPHGLSLGDRACLALAIERKAKVYTTDRAWANLANLSLGIEIEVIR
jgi:PIN domain nuclease of toxin-antitoxin system